MPLSKIREFLSSEEWDAPFFKRLAHNDTAKAPGHQAGIVVPNALRKFFPALDEGRTSARRPTVDRGIKAEMFLGIKQVADAVVRYQFQTWGGTRSPESRITDNLGPLRRRAKKGDILLLQRSADAVDRFRLILITQQMQAFDEINKLAAEQRWGPLFADNEPVTEAALEEAAKQLEAIADQPFSLTQSKTRHESRQVRVARSSAFPQIVRREYDWHCCVSGMVIKSPSGMYEVEAAHVMPVTESGTDDIRNGLSLTRSLHWAFDRGLFGIRPNRKVYIPRRVRSMTANSFLHQFQGKAITEARTNKLRVHEDALAWHMKHRVSPWD